MRYIKTYENINETPKVGDFVQIKTNNKFYGFNEPDKIRNIVNSTIGQITKVEFGNKEFIVKYNNLGLRFQIKDIVEIGKTKEEVELKISSKKYGL